MLKRAVRPSVNIFWSSKYSDFSLRITCSSCLVSKIVLSSNLYCHRSNLLAFFNAKHVCVNRAMTHFAKALSHTKTVSFQIIISTCVRCPEILQTDLLNLVLYDNLMTEFYSAKTQLTKPFICFYKSLKHGYIVWLLVCTYPSLTDIFLIEK